MTDLLAHATSRLSLADVENHSRKHQQRIATLTDELFQLRAAGIKHPIFDFMFSYYSYTQGALKRWHPGPGVILEADPTGRQPAHAQWPYYRRDHESGGWLVDTEAFVAKRETAINYTVQLLAATASRAPTLSCFGLHEWAMAYRSEVHGIRHSQLPLRLGAAGTDEVVEKTRISCSHFDAFRFYAPEARQFNELRPTRQRAIELEQPGCLHANMDLYRHSYKMVPLIDSDLLAKTFELAWEIRVMDMRASPYDISDWGLEPIRIETRDGKAEYVRLQREFYQRAATLRSQLVDALAPWATVAVEVP